MPITRREFLSRAALLALAALGPGRALASCSVPPERKPMLPVQTVLGPVPPDALGLTLIHEHIMCDFIGADQTGPGRWQPDEVVEVMLPYLRDLRQAGARTFVDCSPKFLGRDVRVLRRLAEAAGLHLITNTGLYKEPYLPPYAFEGSVQSLADDWTREAQQGIEDTGVRPGFIKIAANEGDLLPVQQKILRAAAQTHLRTGLTIASHTTQGKTALQQLDLLAREGVGPSAFIWVHADAEPDPALRREAGARGAWIELDGINAADPGRHIAMIEPLLAANLTEQVLISQDAGWYQVGEPRGGTVRPYRKLLTDFVPALREAGIPAAAVEHFLVANPARALTPRVRAA